MKKIITMHGWANDSNFWNNWEINFKANDWIWENAERGYYNNVEFFEPCWKIGNNKSYSGVKALFCHSLGVHLISSSLLQQSSHIVLLNSFSRFIPQTTRSRSIKIALNGMKEALGTEKEKLMLLQFLQKANEPLIHRAHTSLQKLLSRGISIEGRKRLRQDLHLLTSTNKLPSHFPKGSKVLMISGEEDQIVTSESSQLLENDLTLYLDNPPVHWKIKGEGHSIQLPEVITNARTWLTSNQ